MSFSINGALDIYIQDVELLCLSKQKIKWFGTEFFGSMFCAESIIDAGIGHCI